MPLPHWSEPPTGEVPRIFTDETSDDDLETWSTASGSTPRFRTEAGDWAGGDFAEGELAHDDSTAIGALADDYEQEDDELRAADPAAPYPSWLRPSPAGRRGPRRRP